MPELDFEALMSEVMDDESPETSQEAPTPAATPEPEPAQELAEPPPAAVPGASQGELNDELAEAAGTEVPEDAASAKADAEFNTKTWQHLKVDPGPDEDDGPDIGDLVAGFMGDTGLKTEAERDTVDLTKPWMKHHKFNLVKTVAQVSQIIDDALAHGRCSLDLETHGFDNRIDWKNGEPFTRHKIVGYCISVKGVGYYIPVRHRFESDMGQTNPNVTPIGQVEAEIARLCRAAIPELTEEGKAEDPLGSAKIAVPPKVRIYFWHAKFDQEFLFPVTNMDFWHPAGWEDGNLASYVTYSDDKNLGLKAKSKQRLRVYPTAEDMFHEYEMIEFKELFPKGMKKHEMHFADLYPEEGSTVLLYACSDAICTELICEAEEVDWEFAEEHRPVRVDYKNVVGEAKSKKFTGTYRLEKQTVQAVRVMERTRTLIDKDEISSLIEEADIELEAIDKDILAQAEMKGFHDFNPGSAEQLGEFLFSERGLDINPKPEKTVTGQYRTDAGTLEKIADKTDLDIIRQFVKRRQIVKIKGTYLEGMSQNTDEDGRLRFNFKQTGAATGRFTAPQGRADHGFSGIPIQGIPARDDPKKPKVAQSLRRIFISSPGYTFVKIDYAGQELRIVANLSREPLWLKEFREGSGDLHTLTAQAFFGAHITKKDKLERNMAKIANFSLIYGGGVQAIMRATKVDKVEAARKKAAFDSSVPIFAKWVKGQHGSVKKRLGIFTAFGRFIAIPDAKIGVGDVDSYNVTVTDGGQVRKIRAACERKSTNYPIQGSGADILKISMVLLVKELTKRGWLKNGGDDSVRMIMTVHDEICFEIRHDRLQEALPIICNIMESPSRLVGWEIPLVVEPEVALCWAAKYDYTAIMAGKEPVPDWLVGHITPGAAPPELPDDPKPATASPGVTTGHFQTETPNQAAKPQVDSSSTAPAKPKGSNGAIEVATFKVPNTYLTRESIRLVQKAIAGASPVGPERGEPKFRRLQLLDASGDVLVGAELGIHVDPDQFARELRDRNLGKGSYSITTEKGS